MRTILKSAVSALCTVLVVPRAIAFAVASGVIGADRAIESSTQGLARSPGIRGQYLRRSFLRLVGVDCHATATVCFGTTFSKVGAVIGENVYVGPGCHLGLVHLERDVLVAAGVHIPSGGRMHGIDDPTIPIRDQEGTPTMVRIGAGAWIGSGSVVLADVGRNSVVGAGSVVTSPVPANVIAAGVPARVLRERSVSK
jgi:acetyltransferase-like isoleucine patch superfamily enzyme